MCLPLCLRILIKALMPKNTRPKPQCCIVGVSTLVSTDIIVDSTGCTRAVHVTKRKESVKTATSRVINFSDKISERVKVGYL